MGIKYKIVQDLTPPNRPQSFDKHGHKNIERALICIANELADLNQTLKKIDGKILPLSKA